MKIKDGLITLKHLREIHRLVLRIPVPLKNGDGLEEYYGLLKNISKEMEEELKMQTGYAFLLQDETTLSPFAAKIFKELVNRLQVLRPCSLQRVLKEYEL
jgi:hypothetical protein